jgi:hypothetical protein
MSRLIFLLNFLILFCLKYVIVAHLKVSRILFPTILYSWLNLAFFSSIASIHFTHADILRFQAHFVVLPNRIMTLAAVILSLRQAFLRSQLLILIIILQNLFLSVPPAGIRLAVTSLIYLILLQTQKVLFQTLFNQFNL